MTSIAICAPGKRIERAFADRVLNYAAEHFPDASLEFHEQCFAEEGHFAGSDATRLAALLECANDSGMDAVWFAHGGYGSNRIAADAVARMNAAAKDKPFLGYSDTGYLLAALYKAGIGKPAHGPMVADIRHEGGEEAVHRALAYLSGATDGLDATLDETPTAAFNLMTLAMTCGTDLMPDLSGHVVMVEEVSEHFYAVDRLFFHVTQHLPGIAGLRLGRLGDVPKNDRDFGMTDEQIARYWCERTGIPYFGRADIGHDPANRIVPFGVAAPQAPQ